AARVVLEEQRRQRCDTNAAKDRDRRRHSQSKQPATATCCCGRSCPSTSARCGALSNCRRRRTLRETNIENATGCRIRLTCRALLCRNFTLSLLLRRQDRATVDEQRFHISILVIRQNEFGVGRDVELTKWSKVDSCRLIGACLNRR